MSVKVFDAVEFIRGIQKSERNPACFRRAVGGCEQHGCKWRMYCLGNVKLPEDPLSIVYEWLYTK